MTIPRWIPACAGAFAFAAAAWAFGGEDVALVVVTHASSIAMNLWEGCGGAFGARYGAMRRSCLSGWRLAVAPPRVPPPLLRFAPLSPLPLAECGLE